MIEQDCDCNIITFLDTSIYNTDLAPENLMLQIAPPNWSSYYSINYNKEAITLIRPSHIAHSTLPSGIYHIIQSAKPNDKVFIKCCYLNVCNELKEITELACICIDEDESLEELFELKMGLEAAQSLVYSGETVKGKNLYTTIVSKLKIISSKKNCEIC